MLVTALVALGAGCWELFKMGWLCSLSKEPVWRREVKNPELPCSEPGNSPDGPCCISVVPGETGTAAA